MKKFLLLILILGAVGYYYQHHQKQGAPAKLTPIENPTYAQARVQVTFNGHVIDGLMIAQTTDLTDCMAQRRDIEAALNKAMDKLCNNNCTLSEAVCKNSLEPRYLKLFNNEPTHVTYISLARGAADEREIRIIYWGVTVAQSDLLCQTVSSYQRARKGLAQCVRANT